MSRTDAAIAGKIEELPESSVRRKVLECARRFKASWVELGRLLTQVKRDGLWREWGHASFDAYVTKELFIRKQTAEKLTMSYGFLERHEPALAEAPPGRGEARTAPPFEVIEVLSRAEAAGRLDGDRWTELREEVLEAPTASAVNRQLTERLGPAPRPPPAAEEERLGKLLALARRLASACSQDEAVPQAIAERAKALVEDLEEIAES
ncbi:MAG TPA: hypothetical protein VFK90_12840 [Anaeromyxobacter sp.]|nr:hypothetical protein [Anaeromyxobacter sp.]